MANELKLLKDLHTENKIVIYKAFSNRVDYDNSYFHNKVKNEVMDALIKTYYGEVAAVTIVYLKSNRCLSQLIIFLELTVSVFLFFIPNVWRYD